MLQRLADEIGALDVERFTEADLIETLLNAQPTHEGVRGAMRAADLSDALGWSIERTRRKLRVLIGAGKVGVTEVTLIRIDGKPTTVAAYYLMQQPDQLG